MFTIKSFRTDGNRIEAANEKPAFYGMYYNGNLVEYFTSIEACNYARERIEVAINSEANTTVDNIIFIDFKQAA